MDTEAFEPTLKATFELAAVGIAHVALDGKFLRINQKFCEIVGYDQDEIMALSPQAITHPDDLDSGLAQAQRLLAGGGETDTLNLRYFHKDGSTLWVALTVSLVRDETGEPRYFIAVVVDISAQKLAEDALRESEARYRSLVEQDRTGILRSLLDPITIIDRDHKVIWANEPAIEAFGPRLIGEECHWALRGRAHVCESCITKSAFEDGGVHQETTTYTLSDGKKRKFWCSASPATIDSGGEETCVVVAYRDVTEQQKLQEDYDRILNLSGDLICVAGLDGYFKYLNPAWEKILGYKREELLDRPFLDFIHPADHGKNLEEVEKLSFGLVTTDFQNRYIHKDGTIRQISWVASPVPEEELLYCIGRDVTDSKIAEAQIQAHRLRLRRLAAELTLAEERERRRLAANLHDQIGQGLALARIRLASAQKASTDPKLSQALEEISQSLLQAAADTKTLISDLSSPTMNELGLISAVSDWMEENLVGPYGMETKIVQDFPFGRIDGLGDDERAILFRSIRELLTNVVKHADASQVRVHFKEAGDWIQIIVEDDGLGLFPSELDDLPGKSRGFGLFSISERMADLGGSLAIHTQPGVGFEATLNIPKRGPLSVGKVQALGP